ncbi:cupredoxin domain-containing protein [Aquisediminimonas sediminicola]|uniref:cupredoxin domain-containing protein n=1 Tax=Alteraquisediminimonas sediminicola TaxID=2676787 RepID=UPI001C8DC9DB|nr:cupredoxin domain-containing protein [Aquisediminimonas sediminicola]
MPRSIFTLLMASCLASTTATAAQTNTQEAATSKAETLIVVLKDFSFTPSMFELRTGQPYVLHLINRGSGGHNFSAKAFFEAVSINPVSQNIVRNGKIEVAKGAEIELAFIAMTPGTYKLKCSHFLHSGFGMKGRISIR